MSNWKLGDLDRRKEDIVPENAKRVIADAAEEAIRVLAISAEKALATLAAAASAAQTVANLDMSYIKKDVIEIKEMLKSNYVTKEAFNPVKIITYGMTGIALVGVVGAVVSLVIIRH